MTPEERQRTIEFILASQANSAARMDRLEENQAENRAWFDERHRQFAEDMVQLREEQKQQKETVDTLLRVTHNLVKINETVVDRTKKLEGRSDSVEEMIKVLRELLEANLRRPENPPQ